MYTFQDYCVRFGFRSWFGLVPINRIHQDIKPTKHYGNKGFSRTAAIKGKKYSVIDWYIGVGSVVFDRNRLKSA